MSRLTPEEIDATLAAIADQVADDSEAIVNRDASVEEDEQPLVKAPRPARKPRA